MSNPLHLVKIEILTRLLKEDAITLNEALLLLKDEESTDSQDYIPDSSYWTSNLTNSFIHFDDGSISN